MNRKPALNTSVSSMQSKLDCGTSTGGSTSESSASDPTQILHPFQFPWRLHEMLEAAEAEGYSSVVSWLPDECSFKVHKQEQFVNLIMPRYFNQTKYRSFQRQLNVWGFGRLSEGAARGGYAHKFFVRKQPSLCHKMKRERTKGSKKKQTVSRKPVCVTPPSCITIVETFNFEKHTQETPSFPALTPYDPVDLWSADAQNNAYDLTIQRDLLEPTPIASESELVRNTTSYETGMDKPNGVLSEDLKYIMIGLKFGNTIFAQ